MDITGLDLAQLGTCVAAIIGAAKAIKGNRDITRARAETRLERNEEIQGVRIQLATIRTEHNHFTERLNSGDARFNKLETKIDGITSRQDTTNQELSELKGMIRQALENGRHL